MPTIEIDTSERIQRHLAAVRLMSYMVFPDDPGLRAASENTFRTKLADWYSQPFTKQEEHAQRQVLLRIGPKLGDELPRALADPSKWMRNRLFNDFLEPLGGAIGAALALTESPSAGELEREWTGRWWAIVYAGKR